MIFELSSSLVVESFESEQEKEEEEDQSESYKSPVTAQTSGGDTEGGTIGYKLESEIGKIEDSFEQSKEPNSSPVSEDGEKVFDVYHKVSHLGLELSESDTLYNLIDDFIKNLMVEFLWGGDWKNISVAYIY
uniref:Uncharacterized protein n=1 Tax=Timema douglasi TaxID=61478 RepID=A0A7R8VFC3_TIMDO|nr:unnamed protein product [Timema douglasi]